MREQDVSFSGREMQHMEIDPVLCDYTYEEFRQSRNEDLSICL